MVKKVVIIGGVAGGASAAARYRRLDEFAEIIMIEKGPYVSFANCGLPYYVGNVIKDRTNLELMDPELFLDRFNIDVWVKHEALSVDKENKKIKVKNLEKDEEFDLIYDVLVLSPGAKPIVPPFKGINDIPIFTIRNIPDSVEIERFVSNNKPKSAVIVGGGFIGIEMAENLVERGVFTTIVELVDQVMLPLDKEMAQYIHQELLFNGVDLVLGDGVSSFEKTPDGSALVFTSSGKKIEADMVILAIGVKADTDFLKNSGLKMTDRGFITVNNKMQTSDPNIYAVGDAVQVENYITREQTWVALAGPANQQGRIAANNIAGKITEYVGVLGASVVKAFDLTVSAVGLNEKTLKKTDIKFEKIYVHPNNHAGYYPGAMGLTLKLIFEVPSGKILGAQVVGGAGAEKRIDVLSTAIQFGGTVFDLEQLQLSYAPPFSSAKDPVNMAGYVASNVLRGDLKIWQWHQVDELKKKGVFFLDVRTIDEFQIGHIEGAVNIDDIGFREGMNNLPQNKETPIYVYCQAGFRAYLVYRILIQRGYKNVYNLTGGFSLLDMATMTIDEMKKLAGDPKEIMADKVSEITETTQLGEIKVDACGLACPGPVNELIKAVKKTAANTIIEVTASDPSFSASVDAWTSLTDGVELVSVRKKHGNIVARVKKLTDEVEITVDETPDHDQLEQEVQQQKEKKGRVKPAGELPYTNIYPEELHERCCTDAGPAIKIDVRPHREIRQTGGTIPETKIIPLDILLRDTSEIDQYKDKEIVIICASGGRSMMAAQVLARKGFKDVRSLYGGAILWMRKGYEMDTDI